MELTFENNTLTEDRELMEGLLRRLPDSLERLYRRYRAVLGSIIMQVVHNEAETEDVLQEVFLQVWNRADTYSPKKGKLLSWLCTLARRRAIDRLRQQSAYRRATDRYEVSCNHDDKELAEIRTVERDACRDDLRALLQKQIDALPSGQQEAIRMAFFESRSQREIAGLTGTPLGTVKTRIELGLKKLGHTFSGLREELF